MASVMENFDHNGPKYLTRIDWNNWHHRKSIMASLVKVVYTLESDRKRERQDHQALAPEWWKSFNFELNQVLEDEQDKSIFGAIFKSCPNYTGQGPPKYVIAFRVTVNKPENVPRDYKQNLQVFLNGLKKSPRVRAGMEAAMNIVREANGPGNVWLAGHSAGSSVALLIGRKMMEAKYSLETYLFNPPFLSFPIERIKSENLKDGLRIGKSFLTAGLVFVANGGHRPTPRENDPFNVLSTWVPHLFVNKSDPICSNYVGYFEHRKKMKRMGFGKIGNISTQHSIRSIMYHAIGKDSEPIHLLPSAHLTINISPPINMRKCEMLDAHGIHQWWNPDLQVNYKFL
ncbi:Hypothetical predicted protein [Olea europaea subsp. europaea]|uniref:Uncharacterized protein n=1 Tax=Olea europaea subsp. europaea TaxID=158383 RepID=A0A8S0T2J0_OLEEU|nr:Hypothetical predicted protein [Olea europaea subsp. europaea]